MKHNNSQQSSDSPVTTPTVDIKPKPKHVHVPPGTHPNSIANLRPFKAGHLVDPRINRTGIRKPTSFQQLRSLAQQIANEPATDKKGQQLGKSNVELVLEYMARDPKLMVAFLEFAFGRVPNALDLTSNGQALGDNMIRVIEHIKGKGSDNDHSN
jgi:hypothetical protein